MDTAYATIRVDTPAPAVMRITLAREKQLNAYSMQMCRELLAALQAFDRDDAAYFAPLRGLRLPERTRLYLGLIHHDDAEGDRRRMDAARAAVGGGFGVATECGWGRGEPARLDGLLESHRRAVDYLLAGVAR